MKKKELLNKLQKLHKMKEVKSGFPSREACLEWSNKVAPLLKFNDQYYINFLINAHKLILNLSSYSIEPAFRTMVNQLQMAIEELKSPLEEDIYFSNEFWKEIHPKITEIAESRFKAGHFADAAESSFKEINSCVKKIVKKMTREELDGSSLMKNAFSLNNPIIVLDDLSTESGKNIQLGYMEIFSGSMIGIRNPKVHANLNITENRAKHFIFLASLLMFKIEERIQPPIT